MMESGGSILGSMVKKRSSASSFIAIHLSSSSLPPSFDAAEYSYSTKNPSGTEVVLPTPKHKKPPTTQKVQMCNDKCGNEIYNSQRMLCRCMRTIMASITSEKSSHEN